MIRILIYSTSLLALGLPGETAISTDNDEKAFEICQKTFSQTKSIRTLRYEMRKEERIDGSMQLQVSFIKLNRDPYQVYMKQLAPKNGLEVLYKENENEGKALVSPNGFPWITMSMDPDGSTMRKNQHHSSKDAGFDLVISILEYLFKKYASDIDDMFSLSDDIIFNEHACYQIIFMNPRFNYISYQVKNNDDIFSIARKFKISSYLILERNQFVDHYQDVKEGDQIMIPSDYAARMELLIDKKRMIPLSIKVFDEQGLFEHYQYSRVEINPPLTPEDFSAENSHYGF